MHPSMCIYTSIRASISTLNTNSLGLRCLSFPASSPSRRKPSPSLNGYSAVPIMMYIPCFIQHRSYQLAQAVAIVYELRPIFSGNVCTTHCYHGHVMTMYCILYIGLDTDLRSLLSHHNTCPSLFALVDCELRHEYRSVHT